jgi:hypothetical protein
MELTIGAWYPEPGINFEFSDRIPDFIQKAILECVMAPLGLIEAYPEKSLHVRVTTASNQDTLAVKMGPFRENSTSVNVKLWFPYDAIVYSEKPLEAYVEHFIQSIPFIFDRWGVTEKQIHEAAAMIRGEVIHNPYYELTEEERSQLQSDQPAATRILKSIPTGNNLPKAVVEWFRKVFGRH